jgi:diguanylate cyclase (GGDEF)-like protein/PAS domain S-box-containing protein
MIAAPLLALVLLGVTSLFWLNEERARHERRVHVFGTAVERVVSNLSDRLAAFEIVLRGVKGYYEGSDTIDPAEFHAYFEALKLPQSRLGLQGIALLAQVPAAQREQHEVQMRALGLAGYRMHPRSDQPVQAPVTHVEPQTPSNQELLGLFALAHPARREALERARDSGGMALTGPLNPADAPVLLAIYLPLYPPGAPQATVAQRRAGIEGWVVARFFIAEVIRGLAQELDTDLALAIHDGPSVAGGEQIFASRADYAPAAVNGGLESVRSLDVGGRRWTLVLYPQPSFEQRFEGYTHHLIALLGVAFSLLAGWFLGMQISARRRAVALAHGMTRELRRARDALEDTLNAVPDLLLELDGDGRIHHYRSARSDLACVPPEDQIGRLLAEVLPPEAAAEFMSALAEARAQGHSEGRQYCVPMHGALRWFELSVARKEGEGGSLRFIALARDVSSRHEAEAAMHRLAHFDALTALPNRRLLLEQMHAVLLAARNGGELGGLFYIDLDNFKQINDARGHEVGDHLLVQAAKRLRDLAAPADTVARLGGDEFVMLVPHLGRDTGAARLQALQFAQRLRDSLDAPYAMDGARYSSTASIGVTLFPKGAEGVADLLREADTAMFRAKDQGRNQVCFFEQGMHAAVQERLALEQDLKSAVANDALATYVQPQVDAKGRLTGGELLLRWSDPVRGAVPPARFIAAAEEAGLIARMGARVIHQACAALAELAQRGRALSISVNVSPRQFRQVDFVAQVRQALADTGAPAHLLTLEVTEGLLVENWQDTAERMNELVALGVRFSIDDFGTGYSSLAYLKKLPLYELKIDRSFVQDTPGDPNDAAIVQAILSVAGHLGLRVVAEGVETQEQADFLTSRHCDGLQGYLFGRPEPLAGWLARIAA